LGGALQAGGEARPVELGVRLRTYQNAVYVQTNEAPK
jgi:hypothetical protein